MSTFRNSASYVSRYFAQIDLLQQALIEHGHQLQLILGEGDSTDNTRDKIQHYLDIKRYNHLFVDVTHYGPSHGSIVHAQRFEQLAGVWNQLWVKIPETADVVATIEADLIWDVDTALTLIKNLEQCPCVAPMIFCPKVSPTFFYDTWAFRKNGVHFSPEIPYYVDDVLPTPDLVDTGDDGSAALIQIDSGGSFLVIRGSLARQVTLPVKDVVVGLCREMYERGGSVWLNTEVSVVHP